MNLKKLNLGLVALVLGFGLVVTQSAFTPKTTPIVYAYTSNSTLAADIKDINNWEVADSQSPNCGESGSLVCRYSYDGDMSAFQDFLELPTTTDTNINSNAIALKD